ncbi:MAG: snoRNA-binding rRNA-processing protein utp10 [Vezdaea aestivalis]|nr:MAG: snoRNA-binding rRNA-processing protein utp10 [Vezdaea aestivalis]
MATSLAKQLSQIAAKSTNPLNLKAQKIAHSKSLIYDPNEAASQDYDLLYSICIESFSDLCQLDPRFRPFGRTLFSDESRTQERSQMTQKENELLDKEIESFMRLAGGRLALRPGVKAFEWLIRRFRLFANFNTYVLEIGRLQISNDILVKFWFSVMTETTWMMLDKVRSGRKELQNMGEEDTLRKILPIISQGLLIKKARDIKVGCYAMIAAIVSKTELTEVLSDSLMTAVVENWSQDTKQASLDCLSILARNRRQALLPMAVVKRLGDVEQPVKEISSLSSQSSANLLLYQWAYSLLQNFGKHEMTGWVVNVKEVLSSGSLGLTQMETLVSLILQKAVGFLQSPVTNSPDRSDGVASLIQFIMESKEIDSIKRKILSESKTEIEMIEMKTQLRLIPFEPPAETSDVEMTNTDEPSIDPLTYSALVQKIPNEKIDNLNFLHPKASYLFGQLSQLLLASITSSQLEDFGRLQICNFDRAFESLTFFSFLIRVWSGNFPVSARVSALSLAKARFSADNEKNVDCQAIIPYIISALADPAERVRQAAAGLCVAVADVFRSELFLSNIKTGCSILGGSDFYGDAKASSSLEWLSSKDIAQILHLMLLSGLEGCFADENHVYSLVASTLKGVSVGDTARYGKHSKLKSEMRSRVMAFLAGHAFATPLSRVKLRLLRALNRVEKAGDQSRSASLLPILQGYIGASQSKVEQLCDMDKSLLSDLDQEVFAIATVKKGGVDILLNIVSAAMTFSESDGLRRQALLPLALNRLAQIWPAMKHDTMVKVSQSLLLASIKPASTDSISIEADALSCLRSLEYPTEVLVAFIDSLPSPSEVKELLYPPRKRKADEVSEENHASQGSGDHHSIIDRVLKQYHIVVELVGASKKQDQLLLVSSLFHLLGNINKLKGPSGSELAYMQESVLGDLYSIIEIITTTKARLNLATLRIHVLIETIESTTSVQAQNRALLTLASLAGPHPNVILHTVMPIFTFMGKISLVQEDELSIHAVNQTIHKIIPPLVQSFRRERRDPVVGVAGLLKNLVAAFKHMPVHRRLPLFIMLVDSLGPVDFLYALLVVLADKFPDDESLYRFMAELGGHFDCDVQLLCCDLQSTAPKKLLDRGFKNLQIRNTLSERLLKAIVPMLSSRALKMKVSRRLQSTEAQLSDVRPMLTNLVELLVQLGPEIQSAGLKTQVPGEILKTVLGLLNTLELTEVVRNMSSRSNEETCRKALVVLQTRVEAEKQVSESSRTALLGLLPDLTQLMSTPKSAAFRTKAVDCIDLICERFGKTGLDYVFGAAEVVAGLHGLQAAEESIQVVSLLCVASMTSVLQSRAIPLIPDALATAFGYIRSNLESDSQNQHIHDSALILVTAVLQTVPWIVSEDQVITLLDLLCLSGKKTSTPELSVARDPVLKLLPQTVDFEVMLRSLNTTWKAATESGQVAIREHLGMLDSLIDQTPKQITEKTSIFEEAILCRLSLRCLMPNHEVEDAEQFLVGIIIKLVAKLNNKTFRPIFEEVIAWFVNGDAKIRKFQAIAFYNLCEQFFETFKSLVTSYGSYLIEPSVLIIAGDFAGGETNKTLSERVEISMLRALQRTFSYDSDEFWQSPSHFDPIMTPLVEWLSTKHTDQVLVELINTIVEFAVAADSGENHKRINMTILHQMRARNASYRLAAIKCQMLLAERLGEEWLNMLPEMLPFISELQEDEDEQVSLEAQRWIVQMEGITGEQLDDMLA